jgi:uncharacterized protein
MGFRMPRANHRRQSGTFITLVVGDPQQKVVCEICHLADNFLSRMRGLLGRRALGRGEGVLLRPAAAVHTWFMRFPIDVLFLDRKLEVVAVRPSVKPWRAAAARGACAVLELRAGESDRRGIQVGDRIGMVGPASTGAGELLSLLERVGSLLRADQDHTSGTWTEIETILTEGYAHTLRLEAQRLRIEARLAEPRAPINGTGVARIRSLVNRHEQVNREIEWLRALLAELHDHGASLRHAGS